MNRGPRNMDERTAQLVMMRHLQRRVPTSDDILPCVQSLRAIKARGLPLGPLGPVARGQEDPLSAPWLKGSFLAGLPAGRRDTKKSGFPCRKKEGERCVRPGTYFFASLTSVAAARTLVTSKALKQGHSASQNRPPFCASMIWEKV